jgi:hypothetical protein
MPSESIKTSKSTRVAFQLFAAIPCDRIEARDNPFSRSREKVARRAG